ncbi:hypothetical protein D3C72_1888550 [compost metagenome]
MCSIAYFILAQVLIRSHGKDSEIAHAIRTDIKGKFSTALYAIALPVAFYFRYISLALYVTVAIIWFIPDSRVEKVLKK